MQLRFDLRWHREWTPKGTTVENTKVLQYYCETDKKWKDIPIELNWDKKKELERELENEKTNV